MTGLATKHYSPEYVCCVGPRISQILFGMIFYLFSKQSTTLAITGWKTQVKQCIDVMKMEQLMQLDNIMKANTIKLTLFILQASSRLNRVKGRPTLVGNMLGINDKDFKR